MLKEMSEDRYIQRRKFCGGRHRFFFFFIADTVHGKSCEVCKFCNTFVLRSDKPTTFELKFVRKWYAFQRVIQIYTKFANFCKVRFSVYLRHLTTKLCNFTKFKMLFLAVPIDFVPVAQVKRYQNHGNCLLRPH